MQGAERRVVPPKENKTYEVEDDAAARQQRIRATSERILELARTSNIKLPMLPETATEAMVLANDPNTAMNKLERTIVRDAGLAARMLTVASSPAYAGTPVKTLAAALQRLGAGAVRDILYQSVMDCHVFRGENERAARAERDHAVAVGRLSRGICKLVGIDQDYAFVCGLLHDIGRIALSAMRSEIRCPTCTPRDFLAIDDVVHTNLGAMLGNKWKLPALALEAARRHHKYIGFGEDGMGYSQIGHVVNVADRITAHLGVGRAPRDLVEADLSAIFALGCDPAALVELARAALA